jgi:hypothetical protein
MERLAREKYHARLNCTSYVQDRIRVKKKQSRLKQSPPPWLLLSGLTTGNVSLPIRVSLQPRGQPRSTTRVGTGQVVLMLDVPHRSANLSSLKLFPCTPT